jgi:hypothetical protein
MTSLVAAPGLTTPRGAAGAHDQPLLSAVVVDAAVLREATSGLAQRSDDMPLDALLSREEVEMAVDLRLLDESEGGAQLFGRLTDATTLLDSVEELYGAAGVDDARHDVQMTPYTLVAAKKARAARCAGRAERRSESKGPPLRDGWLRAHWCNRPRGWSRA